MKTNYQKVLDFNTCFNHKVSTEPYEDVFDKDPKLVKLRLDLIEEEIKELCEAYKNKNVVEIIDALSDILYVGYGLCVCFGINIDEKFAEYIYIFLDNQLSEKYPSNELEILSNFKKVQLIIPISNNINEYEKNIENYVFKSNLETIKNYIIAHFKKLCDCCESKNFDELYFNIFNVLKYTYLFGVQIGINLDKSFAIVHDSNMTKICDTEELAIETVKKYKENNRYDSPNYKKNNFGYIIYNDNSGKILKSIKYTPADFSCLLN